MIYEHLVLDGELSAYFQWYTISVSSGKMMDKGFHSHKSFKSGNTNANIADKNTF